jgi:hypothetical protein
MRNCFVILFTLAIITGKNNLFAQSPYSMTNDSAGIYLTFGDFENGKLINGFKPHQNNFTLWPQGFFRYKDVELKTPDTTIVYKRSDIWGYTDHKGRLIRVFNNRQYKVLCDKGLIIYIIYTPTRTSYHFSKTLNDPIYRLIKNNLATVYADNIEILQRIYYIKKKVWLIWDESKESYFINMLFLE